MHSEGAQIIDIGAESTRPGSDPVTEHEELSRILPVLEKIPKDQFLISIDTTKKAVAEAALQSGVHIINDVSGGQQGLFKSCKKNIMLDLCSCIVLVHPKICRMNPFTKMYFK